MSSPSLRIALRVGVLLGVGVLACACGATTTVSAKQAALPERHVLASLSAMDCPRHVLAEASLLSPIAVVTRAAQKLLARQTIESQGTLYHLTPRNAPIDVIEAGSLAMDVPPSSVTVPGLVTIHRAAVAACGEQTANASWIVHYPSQLR
jgi:hypothetical protein